MNFKVVRQASKFQGSNEVSQRRADFIVKKEPFGGKTKIRKDLIVEDAERSTALEVAAGVAAVGIAVAVALSDIDKK